jgi:peptidoglycan/xylan/chitin deacetylase (PgdA/CDA1 family)
MRAAALAVLLLLCAPAAASGAERVQILLYHHIAKAPAGVNPALYVPPKRFAAQMAALDRAGFQAVTLDRVWRAWHGGRRLPRRPVVIAFDDGYADQIRAAARVLHPRRWPGVLNLWVGRLGAGGGVTSAQVRGLVARGWEVDPHSLTHADLTTLSPGALREEVDGSRREIRRLFGEPADFFAYPYGRFDGAVMAAVREAGYKGATTTRRGAATPGQNPFALRRTIVTGRTKPSAVVRFARR